MTIYTATITLILVMDPMGNVPLFLALLKNIEPKRRIWILLRESFIAYIILVLFLFSGKFIMHGLGLSEEALRIAGGIILFLIAIKMIFPNHDNDAKLPYGEPFIVPMAIPLIAGPSSLATVVLFATTPGTHSLTVLAAVTCASLAGTAILLMSEPLRRVLRDRGLIAVERLMGMILTTLAVQMFLTGVAAFLK
jgi:MarC family membrane protein